MSASGDNQRWQELLERRIEAFDAAWQRNSPSQIEDFLELPPEFENALAGEPASRLRRELLGELIKLDLEYRWQSASAQPDKPGSANACSAVALQAAPLVEDYLRRFPELGSIQSPPLELIAEEYWARHKGCEPPSLDSYYARFPALAGELKSLLGSLAGESLADTTGNLDTDVRPAVPSKSLPQPLAKVEPRGASNEEALPDQVGRYRVLSQLGRGSFGTVYLGHDVELDREVAIKVPRPGRWTTPADLELFFGEARLSAQVRHPALVEVFDVGRDPACGCYVVMEYVAGRPLSDVLLGEPIEPTRAVSWMAQVAEAVHCAHKVGLVHCDLKPANILLDRGERPHVADFGLTISESEQWTQAGVVRGSPAYMAPEQIRGEVHRFDGRTDLWALGVILYELLTGRRPFSGSNVTQLFDEIQHREPKPPRQITEAIPAALESICLKCLAKDVRERYTNGFDLAADLRWAIDTVQPRSSQQAAWPAPSAGVSRVPPSQVHSAFNRSAMALSNLPSANQASFIGRERELTELSAWFRDPDTQLVTLLGPGGMGKTRLAVQLARQLVQDRPGGCWFAELSECRTAADVAHAVARALHGSLPENEPPVQAVAHMLEYRAPLLLVLDNFEQAVSSAQETVGVWRQAARHVQFLVTSRAALELEGERTYELGPLAAPPHASVVTSDSLEQFASVQLFLERAREAQPNLRLDAHGLQSVGEICRDLEGIPLAIELAAARTKVLTPEELSQRLDQKFELLRSSRRDIAPRQQTLWSAIEWSVDLLCDWERHAFFQVCAFRGGFDWEAAEAVVDLSAFPQAATTVDAIQSLRDKSLLTRQDTPFGTRFGLYQSIREYGERRAESEFAFDQQQALQRRMADHFVTWAEAKNAQVFTAAGGDALFRLELEMENLFAVQDRALATGDATGAARAILAVARALAVRGPVDQRLPRLQRSLTALGNGPSPLAAALLTAASEAGQTAGEWDQATAWASQAVALASEHPELLAAALRQQGEMSRQRGENGDALQSFSAAERLCRQTNDRHGLACSLASLGFVVWQQGDADSALRLLTEADQITRSTGAFLDGITVARRRGHILAQQGETFAALRCYAEAEAAARELKDSRSIRLAIGDRGNVLATQGDFAGASDCYQQAENLARRLGDKRGIAMTLGNRGVLFADRGEPQAALECYEQAEAINRAIQSRHGIAVNLGNRGVALADLGRFDEALASLAAAEDLNRQMGNKFLLALNRGDRADVFYRQSDFSRAKVELSAARELLDAVHSGHTLEGFCFQALEAVIDERLGNRSVAEQLAVAALKLAAQLQLTDAHPKLKIRAHLAALHNLTGTADS